MRGSLEAMQSYFAATLGFMADVNWMAVGAGALLIARLIQDIPPAIEMIAKYIKKDN